MDKASPASSRAAGRRRAPQRLASRIRRANAAPAAAAIDSAHRRGPSAARSTSAITHITWPPIEIGTTTSSPACSPSDASAGAGRSGRGRSPATRAVALRRRSRAAPGPAGRAARRSRAARRARAAKPFQPIATSPRITSRIAASHAGTKRSSASITRSATLSRSVLRRIARVASPSVSPAAPARARDRDPADRDPAHGLALGLGAPARRRSCARTCGARGRGLVLGVACRRVVVLEDARARELVVGRGRVPSGAAPAGRRPARPGAVVGRFRPPRAGRPRRVGSGGRTAGGLAAIAGPASRSGSRLAVGRHRDDLEAGERRHRLAARAQEPRGRAGSGRRARGGSAIAQLGGDRRHELRGSHAERVGDDRERLPAERARSTTITICSCSAPTRSSGTHAIAARRRPPAARCCSSRSAFSKWRASAAGMPVLPAERPRQRVEIEVARARSRLVPSRPPHMTCARSACSTCSAVSRPAATSSSPSRAIDDQSMRSARGHAIAT